MSDLRRAPSGQPKAITLYDKDGVAYEVNTIQLIALKLGLDPSDAASALLDARAQYYTRGDVTTLSSGDMVLLNICQTLEGVSGSTTSFNLLNVVTGGQYVLMGLRVTLVTRLNGVFNYVKQDDLVFGVYLPDADLGETNAYLTDTQATEYTGDPALLTPTGGDSTTDYLITVTASGDLSVQINTPVDANVVFTAHAELFVYETKNV
jgi:hypothetical protein